MQIKTERQIDCLLIGYNEPNFHSYEKMVSSMGANSGAYRDLRLNFVEVNGDKFTPVGLLNHLRSKKSGKESNLHCGQPLNLATAYLSSYLQRRGLSTEYVNLFQKEKEKLGGLLKNNVKTVAITTTFYISAMPIIEIITFIRKYNRSAKIIIGGPFISNQCAQNDQETLDFLLNSLGADFYINSTEGEHALYRTIEAIKNKQPFDGIENLIYHKGKELVYNTTTLENNNLDENYVKWNLFSRESIGNVVQIRTARGCAFRCAFCGYPVRAGNYTYANVETVEKELSLLKEVGDVSYLTFIDDTFNVPQERFKEICRMMIENQYGFKWFSYLRCQYLDRETVELMKASGCDGVFLGVESGSPEILTKMNKSAAIDDYRRGIALLNEYGIVSFASFIVGFPGETVETVQETVNFIEETKPTFYRAQMWYCDPITPIFKEGSKYQIEGNSFNWKHSTMNCDIACRLIDNMVCTVQNSTWLSQYNFDFWMIPTLLGNGMKLEQFMAFVKGFEQLLVASIEKDSNGKSEQAESQESLNVHMVLKQMENACDF